MTQEAVKSIIIINKVAQFVYSSILQSEGPPLQIQMLAEAYSKEGQIIF